MNDPELARAALVRQLEKTDYGGETKGEFVVKYGGARPTFAVRTGKPDCLSLSVMRLADGVSARTCEDARVPQHQSVPVLMGESLLLQFRRECVSCW